MFAEANEKLKTAKLCQRYLIQGELALVLEMYFYKASSVLAILKIILVRK